jgi:hypothetical protein
MAIKFNENVKFFIKIGFLGFEKIFIGKKLVIIIYSSFFLFPAHFAVDLENLFKILYHAETLISEFA